MSGKAFRTALARAVVLTSARVASRLVFSSKRRRDEGKCDNLSFLRPDAAYFPRFGALTLGLIIENTFLSTEGTEGHGELLYCPRSHAKGRGEHLFVRGGTRRGAENTRSVSGFLCATAQSFADQPQFAFGKTLFRLESTSPKSINQESGSGG